MNAAGACVVGGEEREVPPALRDVTATLTDLAAGRETIESLFGRQPGVWGRRRFGVSPLTPQLAGAFGYAGALRLNFGGGEFLGKEDRAGGRGVARWAGAEGEIAAHTRDPLPAGDAAAWWRLPDVLADAFEQEQTVAVTFARWPGGDCVWLDDLKTLTSLSPALGEFRTYEQLFAQPDPFARLLAADPRTVRSRELEAAVAAATAEPITAHAAAVRADAEAREDIIFAGLADLLERPASGGRQPSVAATGDAAEPLAALIGCGGGDAPRHDLAQPAAVPAHDRDRVRGPEHRPGAARRPPRRPHRRPDRVHGRITALRLRVVPRRPGERRGGQSSEGENGGGGGRPQRVLRGPTGRGDRRRRLRQDLRPRPEPPRDAALRAVPDAPAPAAAGSRRTTPRRRGRSGP